MQVIFNGFEDNLKTWENAPKTFMREKSGVQNFIEERTLLKVCLKNISKIFL